MKRIHSLRFTHSIENGLFHNVRATIHWHVVMTMWLESVAVGVTGALVSPMPTWVSRPNSL